MKPIAETTKLVIFTVLLPAGIILQSGCSTLQSGRSSDVFFLDQAGLSGAKRWTCENFKNDPDHSQFAVIGDRTAGAAGIAEVNDRCPDS